MAGAAPYRANVFSWINDVVAAAGAVTDNVNFNY
jgi:hypothetical protein